MISIIAVDDDDDDGDDGGGFKTCSRKWIGIEIQINYKIITKPSKLTIASK